ncbi:uncharacterized protein CLAFUR5_13424 [Fulvia fulva]|uniref:GPI anchored protein n=1 Tax=Passalora fulva TaxID=5499 RepID=A0A9Q8PKV3_PASFU|nr:uncharacterized protein CLAFUR5_13424 [Fulvia fulva]KAK4610802.1 hypothetical protein CLAFUR0_13584 [Fulvia fulva]UJO24277.1 hypothetical protein CLAFUR5_13424 [Fulvia fulva]
MRGLTKLLSLPASLLILALGQCADAQDPQWRYNLPRNAKYYPEDESHVKRGLEAQERLQWHAPQGVRKMGDDAGEKFFLDYWDFGEQVATDSGSSLDVSALRRPVIYEDATGCDNDTGTCRLHAPFRGQANHERSPFYKIFGRSNFKREFECPTGTNSCSNVGSDLCCQSSETCVNTDDGVGCCPNGASCGQEVAECDTGAGYSSCPDSSNRGCCLPDFECLDTGCVFYGTSTVVATATPATVPAGTINPTTMTERPEGTTVIVAGEGSTTTVTITNQGTTVTTTVISPTTIIIGASSTSCSSEFFSCPSSLGGGCCRNGQGCATNNSCPDLTTTTSATARPPDRPTSSADSSITAADTTITSQPAAGGTDSCPTGFYMCSAVYLGGCCRVDRNCDTTSCPEGDRTAVVTSGVTIEAGAGATGRCASAWSSCGADVGGGCCPPGFNCGVSCVAETGGQTTARVAASGGAVVGVGRYGSSFWGVGVLVGVGMVWL